jgi:hypothetical protein
MLVLLVRGKKMICISPSLPQSCHPAVNARTGQLWSRTEDLGRAVLCKEIGSGAIIIIIIIIVGAISYHTPYARAILQDSRA